MDELKALSPTMRQRHASALQDLFIKMGADPYKAMGIAQRFTGGDRSAVGLADFTPLGLLYGSEEAGLQTGQGVAQAAQGGTGSGLLNMGLGLGSAAMMAAGPVAKLSPGVVAKFGGKAVREAALAKKVQKSATEVVEDVTRAVRKKGARGAVDPEAFRKMEVELGPEATMAALRRGAHLKPDGKGGYVGGPRTVDSPQALGRMRGHLDEQFADSVEALQEADPTRVGTWYDRAKRAQAATNEPWQLPRSLETHGVSSAGVAPVTELAFALKHGNSRALGEPIVAYRGAPTKVLDSAVAENRPAKMGLKIGKYAGHNDPRIPNTGLFGTNDFRRAQGLTYTLPSGEAWQGGVRKEMHPFIDGETGLQVDRANRAGLGGRTDWQGPHIQEMPWVYDKAQDIYADGSTGKGRFANMPPEEGMAAALVEANNTIEDYLYKHAGAATHEAIPGLSTRHVPSMLTADDAAKQAYGNVGRWDRPSAGLLDDTGAQPIDSIYSAMGLRQLPSVKGTGGYTNSAGQFETNPLTIARPLLDFPTGGGGGRIADRTARAMNAGERFRGVMDAQEASAWNLPNTGDMTGKNAMVFDTRGASPTEGVMPSGDLLGRVNAAIKPQGYGLMPTARGSVLLPFDSTAKPADLTNLMKAHQGLLGEIPGEPSKGVVSSGYLPAIGKWGENDIVPTEPFSGQATMGLLEEMAAAPPEVARNLSESEGIRAIIREKIARDAALPGARRDIQNTRNFFSEADWARAVEMIRSGVKPAAALSALGYSAASLAQPE